MPAQLPYGWVITPTLETVPNPNEGSIPYGTPFFQRWTYICTDADGDYICSSGSLEDCESQAQAMAQAHVQQQPYYPGAPPPPTFGGGGWMLVGGPVPVPAVAEYDNAGYGPLANITAGVVGWAGETVIWSATTLNGTPPTLVPGAGGTVTVAWNGPATITLSATVGGVPQVTSIAAQAGATTVLFGPTLPPLAAAWMEVVNNALAAPWKGNSGTGAYYFPMASPYYAGIQGYVSGAVVWTPTWQPVQSDPPPTLTPLAGGVVQVNWPAALAPSMGAAGLLTLHATVDAVPVGSIEMSCDGTAYSDLAWGPTVPYPLGKVAGWAVPATDPNGPPDYITGISSYAYGVVTVGPLYAGIQGWAGESVAWAVQWFPFAGEPAPTTTPLSGGRLQIDLPALGPTQTSRGALVLTPRINGVATEALTLTVSTVVSILNCSVQGAP